MVSTARGPSTGLLLVGPAKVKARESFLFTEGSLKLKRYVNVLKKSMRKTLITY